MKQFYIDLKNGEHITSFELSAKDATNALVYFHFWMLGANAKGDVISVSAKPTRGRTYVELSF